MWDKEGRRGRGTRRGEVSEGERGECGMNKLDEKLKKWEGGRKSRGKG